MLFRQGSQPVELGIVGGLADSQRLVHWLVDVVLQPDLLACKDQGVVCLLEVGRCVGRRRLRVRLQQVAAQVLLDEVVLGLNHADDRGDVRLLVRSQRHVFSNGRLVAPSLRRAVKGAGQERSAISGRSKSSSFSKATFKAIHWP